LLELHPTGKTKMVLKKGKKSMLTSLKSGWNLLVQDESIFIHIQSQQSKKKGDGLSRKKDQVVTVTGSHEKTLIYGGGIIFRR